MIVYRIGRTKYANDLTGEGARLNGGRWNHKLTPCLYTSESRSLSVLEYTVNVNIDDIPRALSMTTLEIPEKNILKLTIADLPGNWRTSPSPASTKEFGTQLLKTAEYAIIKIPSAVIPHEYNYLLNPIHRESVNISIVDILDFVYDVRIKNR
ncbi:MAG: RES family NAD+ phosphorylase [Bacteroidota bacterium]|nr:RES family NAD+ phosphorylase [Bacteroidota bacterium]